MLKQIAENIILCLRYHTSKRRCGNGRLISGCIILLTYLKAYFVLIQLIIKIVLISKMQVSQYVKI